MSETLRVMMSLALTMQLGQTSLRLKLRRSYTEAVILNHAFSTVPRELDDYSGSLGIQRVHHQLDNNSIKGGDGNGGLDLSNGLGRQRCDGSQ